MPLHHCEKLCKPVSYYTIILGIAGLLFLPLFVIGILQVLPRDNPTAPNCPCESQEKRLNFYKNYATKLHFQVRELERNANAAKLRPTTTAAAVTGQELTELSVERDRVFPSSCNRTKETLITLESTGEGSGLEVDVNLEKFRSARLVSNVFYETVNCSEVSRDKGLCVTLDSSSPNQWEQDPSRRGYLFKYSLVNSNMNSEDHAHTTIDGNGNMHDFILPYKGDFVVIHHFELEKNTVTTGREFIIFSPRTTNNIWTNSKSIGNVVRFVGVFSLYGIREQFPIKHGLHLMDLSPLDMRLIKFKRVWTGIYDADLMLL